MITDRDPLRYFRIEARELVDQLAQGVLSLQDDDPGSVAALLRHAHTLKGAARVVRQTALADLAHALEELLVPYRDGGPAAPVVGDLLRLTDEMSSLVAAIEHPVQAVQPAPADVAAASETAEVPQRPEPEREATADVDELLEAVDEAHARFAPLRNHTAGLERARRAAEALAEQLRDDKAAVRAGALVAELTTLGRRLTETVEQVARELDDIRGRAERLRLVPAATVLSTLHRAVYDAAGTEGKAVRFDSAGGDLRLDPHVLAQAGNALLHVVRNAVSHGVEPQDERIAAGKPPLARVSVDVRRRGRFAAFRCRDDGRGFDLDAVRRQAERRGLVAPGAEADVRELMRLLMQGGISTSERVTGVSGRGIGLDAVRDVAERLGGDVSVSTEPGRGTTVELVVPLALVSLSGLVVLAGGVLAALPLDAVRTCVLLPAVESSAASAAGALAHDGRVLPFLSLARVLAPEAGPGDGRAVAIVLAAGDDVFAVGADRLLGTSTLVVRPLPELAPAAPVIGGVSIDAEGNPRIVLDPAGLAASAGAAGSVAPPRRSPDGDRPDGGRPDGGGQDGGGRDTAAGPAPILVVDDSLTTRMLERSILESAGYRVELAASAEEALERAARRRYALFLVDIDMPGLDGFTFVELTRADPGQRDVPAILVSSRASAEDRRRGLAAGAAAYMVKSEFDQEELLGHIRALVGAPA
ncbi:response regulator [Dactylosporangium vinaceum]|uniref:histidine kinase n=1 Tax=Dactylosporangium vinaceum TaxID=53362 RepID=A0ABV5M4A9_9ACTN|nr:hybrid sensor histidine kinase/response regulator [Dactylosporangium vinaceum]UAB93424.1 response regulator [Dactylosporangium vinaceum]